MRSIRECHIPSSCKWYFPRSGQLKKVSKVILVEPRVTIKPCLLEGEYTQLHFKILYYQSCCCSNQGKMISFISLDFVLFALQEYGLQRYKTPSFDKYWSSSQISTSYLNILFSWVLVHNLNWFLLNEISQIVDTVINE